MTNTVINARTYLEEAKLPVSLKEIQEKTGIIKNDLSTLERNGVINVSYRLTDPNAPLESYLKIFYAGGPYPSRVEKIIKFMLKAPDRIIRKDEICDSLAISLEDGRYVFGTFETYDLVETFYSTVPDNSCEICVHREKCRRDIKAAACQLFCDDWKLAVTADGGEK